MATEAAGERPATPFDLRDAGQAADYLENVGTEYRFQCYSENIPAGCHRLADFHEAFKKDFEKAFTVFETNCNDNKFGHSCFKAGNYSMIGRACEKSYERAYGFYTAGCTAGYGPACHNAGLLRRSGRIGGEPDYVAAAGFLESGCEKDNIPSCQLLSTFYLQGQAGVPKDMQRAATLAGKACEAGHIYACVNLSQIYTRGDGVPQDEARAALYRKRAQHLHANQSQREDTLTFGQ